jgi:hypothetical protein
VDLEDVVGATESIGDARKLDARRLNHNAGEAEHGNAAVLDLRLAQEVHVADVPAADAEGDKALKSQCSSAFTRESHCREYS